MRLLETEQNEQYLVLWFACPVGTKTYNDLFSQIEIFYQNKFFDLTRMQFQFIHSVVDDNITRAEQ